MKKLVFIIVLVSLLIFPFVFIKAVSPSTAECIKTANQNRINAEQEEINKAKDLRMEALRDMIAEITPIREDFNSKKINATEDKLKKLRKDFNAKIKPIQDNYRSLVKMANEALKNNIATIRAQSEKEKIACGGSTKETPNQKKEFILSSDNPKNIRTTSSISGQPALAGQTSVTDIIFPDGYYTSSSMQKDPMAFVKSRMKIFMTIPGNPAGNGTISGEMIIINKKGYMVFGVGSPGVQCMIVDTSSSEASNLREQINSDAYSPLSLMDKYRAGLLEYKGEKPCGSFVCDVWHPIPLATVSPHSSDSISVTYYIDNKSHIIRMIESGIPGGSGIATSQMEYNVQMDDIVPPKGPCIQIPSYNK